MHSTGWRIRESWGSSSVRWIVIDVSMPAILSSCSGESKMLARSKSERARRGRLISAPERSRNNAATLEPARCSACIERALAGEPFSAPGPPAGKELCLADRLGWDDRSERSESESEKVDAEKAEKKTKVEDEDANDDEDDGFKVHTKSAAQMSGKVSTGTYDDITLNCRDCNAEFIFTIGEQEFYATKGWTNQPSRCEPCKKAKKARFGEDAPVCYAFERGECDRGNSCKFAHPGTDHKGTGGGGGGGAGICYAFRDGNCSYGDSCRFSHDPNASDSRPSSRGPTGKCYAFAEGNCTRGDSCRFSHD